MSIFQFAAIGKTLTEIKNSILALRKRFTWGIFSNKHNKVITIHTGFEADDWIIGGRSLAEHCKSMRYVEKNELHNSNMSTHLVLIKSENEISHDKNLLPKTAEF